MIKCSGYRSIYPIALLLICFDEQANNELYQIISKYDYLDKICKDNNILYSSLSYNKEYLVNDKYYFNFLISSPIINNSVTKRMYLLRFIYV